MFEATVHAFSALNFRVDSAGANSAPQSRPKGIQPLEKDPEFKHTSRYETEIVESIVKGERKTKGVKRKRAQRSTIDGDAGGNATAPASRITHTAYDLWGAAPTVLSFDQTITTSVLTLSEEHKEEILPMARNAAMRQKALQEGGKAALPTDMPAVPLPAAGSSYHPEASAHQDLLGEETAKEIHRQRQEEKTHTVLLPDEKMRKQLGLDVYGQRMLTDGGDDSDISDGGDFLVSHDVGDGSGSEDEGARGTAASGAGGDLRLVTAKALTRKDRARRARHEEAEAASAQARHEKKMLRAIDHLDTVKGLVQYEAKQKAKRAALRKGRRAAAKAEARANPPRMLGHKPMYVRDLRATCVRPHTPILQSCSRLFTFSFIFFAGPTPICPCKCPSATSWGAPYAA